jgi:hypothetical protein
MLSEAGETVKPGVRGKTFSSLEAGHLTRSDLDPGMSRPMGSRWPTIFVLPLRVAVTFVVVITATTLFFVAAIAAAIIVVSPLLVIVARCRRRIPRGIARQARGLPS